VARLTGTYLKNSSHTVLDKSEYLYNVGNQRTRLTRTDGSYYTNTYDNIGQLAKADSTVAAEDRGYMYDAAFNLNTRTNNTTPTTFAVDAKNQLSTDGGYYDYCDDNGNLSWRVWGSDPWWWGTASLYYNYNYDDENRLSSDIFYDYGQDPVSKTEYVYDGLGRLRIRKEYTWDEGGQDYDLTSETHYIYDGMRVIQERDGSNVPTVSYTRGQDLSGSMEGSGGIGGLLARSHGYSGGSWSTHNCYHADGNGNITYLVNSSQTVAASYRYDPYGNLISSSGTLASANVYRFSSKEYLSQSGLYYYGYRFYDSNLQRWLNRDPVEEAGGINLYTFALNNANRWVDSLGLRIVIDPRQDPDFFSHIAECLCMLKKSNYGRELYNKIQNHPNTVMISPDIDGAQTTAPIDTRAQGTGKYVPVEVYLHPFTANGVKPSDMEAAQGEAPPNNIKGCAVTLAHEFGHLLGANDEHKGGHNIVDNENPVRRELGIPDRMTDHGHLILLDSNLKGRR
jgi:RHS repeat-associated protein